MYRIALIGSVTSSLAILRKLLEHKLNLVCVLGMEPENPAKISSYVKLKDYLGGTGIPYYPFTHINDPGCIKVLREFRPDIIFAVGLSQLIGKEILDIPLKGTVGFHPTSLPRGRGRTPIAWLILNEKEGAANFFLMGEGMDDGPILASEPYSIDPADNAASVEKKIISGIDAALDAWLPRLKKGEWEYSQQNNNLATYYGRRAPLDGWIDWNNTAEDIEKLVRSATKPHPGAFTFYSDYKVIIWAARKSLIKNFKGVVGRIIKMKNDCPVIQTGEGLIEILDYEIVDYNNRLDKTVKPTVGSRFGYYNEYEIFRIRNELSQIKNLLKKRNIP
jgi:methionyl-tRNA formyltransferase